MVSGGNAIKQWNATQRKGPKREGKRGRQKEKEKRERKKGREKEARREEWGKEGGGVKGKEKEKGELRNTLWHYPLYNILHNFCLSIL